MKPCNRGISDRQRGNNAGDENEVGDGKRKWAMANEVVNGKRKERRR